MNVQILASLANRAGFVSLLLSSTGLLVCADRGYGQIVPDATLGPEASVVLPGADRDRIVGGPAGAVLSSIALITSISRPDSRCTLPIQPGLKIF